MFDSLSRIRLQWMFDNEPERVKELLDKNRLLELEKNLLVSVIPAIDLMAPKTRHELYGGARGGARIPDTEGRPGVQRRPTESPVSGGPREGDTETGAEGGIQGQAPRPAEETTRTGLNPQKGKTMDLSGSAKMYLE